MHQQYKVVLLASCNHMYASMYVCLHKRTWAHMKEIHCEDLNNSHLVLADSCLLIESDNIVPGTRNSKIGWTRSTAILGGKTVAALHKFHINIVIKSETKKLLVLASLHSHCKNTIWKILLLNNFAYTHWTRNILCNRNKYIYLKF